MYERSVKTKSGKEFEVSHAVATSIGLQGMLYIEFVGYEMMDIVPVFSNEDETKVISSFADGEKSREFIGYTKLSEAFFVPENGNLRIRLDYPLEVVGE